MPSATKSRTSAAKPTKCSACGKAGGKHTKDCVNYRCEVCLMMGGNHLMECSEHPNAATIKNWPARAEAATKKGERAPSGTFFAVDLVDGAIEALQRSINDGDFAGDTQKQHQCEFEVAAGDGTVQCTNIAPLKKVVTNHCPTCERDRKETLLRLCLMHGANVWGAGHPSRLQQDLPL